MADKKVSELTSIATVSGDDLLLVVNDPNGTPASRKVTIEGFFSTVDAAADFQENVTIRGSLFIRGDNFIVDANTNFTADVVTVGSITNVESAIKDRMQVANTTLLTDTLTASVNDRMQVANTTLLINDRMQVANAQSQIDDRMQVANTVLLVNDRMQVANVNSIVAGIRTNVTQRLGAEAEVTLTGDVLASATAFSANAVSIATAINAGSGQTIANYMQVANTISISTLQSEVAASTSFEDFKTRIAAL